MAQDQEESMHKLVGLGVTSQEDANGFCTPEGFWCQNLEKRQRATVRKALNGFVEALLERTIRARKEGEMTMRMRMEEALAMRREESPDGPRQPTPNTEEAHDRPKEAMEQEGVGREKFNTTQELPGGRGS